MGSEQLIAMLRSIKADHELSHPQKEALAVAVGLVLLREQKRKALNAAAGITA